MISTKYILWRREFADIREVTYTDKRINLLILKPGVTFSNEENKKNYDLYLEKIVKPRLKEYETAKQAGLKPIIFNY